MDHGANGELSGGPTKHAEALGEPDGGREPCRGETVAGEIDRAGEREGGSRTLEQAAELRAGRGAEAEHDGANGGQQYPDWHDVFRAETIQRCAGDDRECGVGVVVEADQRTHTQRRQSERGLQLWDHHAGCGPEGILAEIEQEAETPGEDVSCMSASSGSSGS